MAQTHVDGKWHEIAASRHGDGKWMVHGSCGVLRGEVVRKRLQFAVHCKRPERQRATGTQKPKTQTTIANDGKPTLDVARSVHLKNEMEEQGGAAGRPTQGRTGGAGKQAALHRGS